MKRWLLLLLFYLLTGSYSFSQDDQCRKSTEGKDFWFGFMESRNYKPNHYLEITVTARETTTFSIKIGPNEVPFGNSYTVNANNSIRVKIPWESVEATGSEEIQKKGIHLVSEKPVNVYALNWDANSADVAVIYPLNSLGKEYFAMCYEPDIHTNNPETGNGRNSEFLIVGTVDSTLIKITPSKVTDKLKSKDSTFIIILNKGEIYQVQSENKPGSKNEGQGDLTGSHIIASHPIAFYSGSLGTRIPAGQCCWDHLFEQIPPVHSWGLEYYAVPLKSREQDRYRVMAANDNTTIHITGMQSFVLSRGEFRELVFYHDQPKKILADKPIMVAQFSQSRDVDAQFTGGNGDPFMIILSSSTQSKNDVTFVAYDSDQISKYYVNIISLTEEVNNILFNGNDISNQFTTFEEGKYSWAQIPISSGTYRINNTNKNRGFLAYVYGYGGVESYGYGVGFNLNLVLDLGESINFEGDTLLLCQGDSKILDAGPYFDNYSWNTGDSTQTLKIEQEGHYHINASTIDGCYLEDSIYVYVSSPETELGIDYEEGCEPFSIELDGGDGFYKYLWQNELNDTLSLEQKFTVNTTGEFRITAFDKYMCMARDTMGFKVFPVPEIKVQATKLVCGKKTAQLTVNISGVNDSIWNYKESFNWSVNNKNSATLTDKEQTSANIKVTEWGTYEIVYDLTTIDNCNKTDTFMITFHPQPNAEFIFEDDEKCEGYSKNLLFTGSASNQALFFWDLDGCQFTDTIGWQNYKVSVGAFLDNPPYISLYINDIGCLSDTILKPMGARPNFTMDANPENGCDKLEVDFTSKLLVKDKVNFLWEFDDGTSAVTQNYEKEYFEPGIYGARLTITNPVTMCQNSFRIDSMVKIYPTPSAFIETNSDQCYPDSAILIYPYNNDSSFCLWEFDGIHQVGEGNDTIKVIIDNPSGKVSLTVSEHGCISEKYETEVKRKPRFDFKSDNREGCQPFTTEIIALPKDSNLSFYWITDSLPYPEDHFFQYNFTDSGKFDVKLLGQSLETGCYDTLIKTNWINVFPKPIADFVVDYPTALIEHSKISFTNQTISGDFFEWDFGDGNSTTGRNVQHTYTELGEFNSQLISDSFHGCKDTAEMLITILPFSVFTPNAFRPLSPIEKNRTFMPLGTGADPERFDLKIFNRHGRLVFESQSPDNRWNGDLPNGKPAAMGNYIWIAIYYDIQNFKHKQQGQVMLIR